MRAANAAEHGMRGANRRSLAEAVGPGAGAIQNPSGVDALIFSGHSVAEQNAACASVCNIDRNDFGVVANHGAGVDGFGQPLGDEAFGEFALRVFVAEQRPALAGIERALDSLQLHFAELRGRLAAGHFPIEPEAGSNFHGAASAVLIQQENEVKRMHEVRTLAEKAFALAQRFADEIDFAMLEVAQTAVDDAGGTAGDAGGEVILLDEQGTLAGTGAFPGDRDSVDSAADDDHVEVLAIDGGARFYGESHSEQNILTCESDESNLELRWEDTTASLVCGVRSLT